MKVTIPIINPELMMNNRGFFVILFFFLFAGSLTLKSQQQDFQCWTSAQFGLEVFRNLGLHMEEEVRFKENCSQLHKQINDLGISYKFNKYLKTSIYYRVIADWKNPDYHEWRQGFYADLALKYGAGRFMMGYRARLQSNRIEFNETQVQFFGEMVNRHKITVEYNIKNLSLAPFAEGELFFVLQNRQNNMSSYRTWIGLAFSPGNIHKFSVKYGIDQELMKNDPLTSYIIAVNYSLSLKL
jgi:hypothetical protein